MTQFLANRDNIGTVGDADCCHCVAKHMRMQALYAASLAESVHEGIESGVYYGCVRFLAETVLTARKLLLSPFS